MLKKVLFFMLIFGVVISPVVMADMLEEANTNFTYEGKPIHPGFLFRLLIQTNIHRMK